MESRTKNRQSEEVLEAIVKKAFGDKQIFKIQELTDGYFNVAYLIQFTDQMEVILKIAPPSGATVMTYEKNIMFSEVDSMKMVSSKTNLPVAKILFYDKSCSLCDSEYFFMEKLKGKSFHNIREELPEESCTKISKMAGEYCQILNQIKGRKFGYYGQEEYQGDNWHRVFIKMLESIITDAKIYTIDFKVDTDYILSILERDSEHFLEVETPCFVHFDLWPGNIFVDENTISGIIDFERCLFADPFMEVGFRTFWKDENFLAGYGITDLRDSQKCRILWYDVYLLMVMACEYDFRQYETKDSYEWTTEALVKWIRKLAQRDYNI